MSGMFVELSLERYPCIWAEIFRKPPRQEAVDHASDLLVCHHSLQTIKPDQQLRRSGRSNQNWIKKQAIALAGKSDQSRDFPVFRSTKLAVLYPLARNGLPPSSSARVDPVSLIAMARLTAHPELPARPLHPSKAVTGPREAHRPRMCIGKASVPAF